MPRATSTILLSCAVGLLATRLISPADSSPRVPPPVPLVIEAVPPQDPMLDTVQAETRRLRVRMKEEPAFPPPSRNPFSFGRDREPARDAAPDAAPLVETAEPLVRHVILPQLVAIFSEVTPERTSRTAVFSVGDAVEFLRAGDSVSAFVVDAVTANAVTLVDRETGLRYDLSAH